MIGRFAQPGGTRELLDQARVLSIQVAAIFVLTGLAIDNLLAERYDDLAMAFHWGALLLAGTPILRSAVRGLAEGHAHVDELVAIAIVAALGANFFLDIPLIAEAAEVAVIMQLGALIEEWASSSAHRSMKSLEALIPSRVQVVSGEQVVEREVQTLAVGDVLLVRPGDRVAADGRIVEGHTSLNQSALTGESLPVERGVGGEALAGTINAGSGTIKVCVEHLQSDSALGRIIKMIRDGEAYAPPVVQTADTFFAYYTPVILFVAALVVVLGFGNSTEEHKAAISAAIAVLVVGCPCPLILASPIALMCGLSRAARAGIAIKAGAFLEVVDQVRTVVFDKTGTLTTGQIRLVSVALTTMPGHTPNPTEAPSPEVGLSDAVSSGASVDLTKTEAGSLTSDSLASTAASTAQRESDLLRLAASAESSSSHPVGQAILRAAQAWGLSLASPANFEQVGGLGVKADVDTRRVSVGSRRFMEAELGAERFAAQLATTNLSASDPSLQVFVAIGGQLAGVLRLEDTVRDEAPAVIEQLRQRGVDRFVLLTGDRREVAAAVAARVGISEVHADLLPADKIARLRELQAGGRKVAMIGDGVNDAPALSAADVGIAVGDTATDVALEAANASLLSGSLRNLPFFFSISSLTGQTIYANLLLAVGFNVVAIAAAAFGLLDPMVAALVHVIATVAITFNSLSLNKHADALMAALPSGTGSGGLVPPGHSGSGGGSAASGGTSGQTSLTTNPAINSAAATTDSGGPSGAALLAGPTLSFVRS